MKILHIMEKFYTGGPARSLIAAVKYARKLNLPQTHNLVILTRFAYPPFLIQAKQAGIEIIIRQPQEKRLHELIGQADIVQVHFWNSPLLYEFLRSQLPAMRLMLWLKVVGQHPPQTLTHRLIDFADKIVATTPATGKLSVWETYPVEIQQQKQAVVPGIADFSRLLDCQPEPHDTFNVGYIGTVNFSKMYARYVPMHSKINIPNVKFIVCGGGIDELLAKQAQALGTADKFEFCGYRESIKPILSNLDVFGYPLCPDTYATSEKSLQEAMYAGIPAVVFPHGGLKHLVQHEKTGLVVYSESEYQQAIEFLYHHPQERKRLGQNAQRYAQEKFLPEMPTQQMHQVYEQMLYQDKRVRRWPGTPTSRAEEFIETLGENMNAFAESYRASSLTTAGHADQLIAQSSPLLAEGEGGITHYRNTYPDDCHLRFWSGLCLQAVGKEAPAIAEFQAAIALGFPDERPLQYISDLEKSE
ncbi:MAG: glycosyltransferase family 4 protein [Cyanobacteria bacterium P01_H01_bin.15]